jgi:aspartyl-tRNA(Asn)/glutamyl-tRNA(Gln) amidotransferase subunit C
MQRAGQLIGKMKLPPKVADAESRVRAAWPAAAGKKIARHTLAVALVRDTLVVEVGDLVWQRQLNTLRHFLLRNLRRELGETLVKQIDFRSMLKRREARGKGSAVRIIEDEVRKVAELANLALSEDEVARMARDLSGVLAHVDKLNELDTAGVEPMTQVLYNAEENATLREDETRATLSNAEALGNAPVAGGGYFKVPLVIER